MTAMPLFERALRRHLAGLQGLAGVQGFVGHAGLGPAGDWTEAARFGDVPLDVYQRILDRFDPEAGGSVEPLGDSGEAWLATYMVSGPGLDLVLIFKLSGLNPAQLQTTLSAIETRAGWLFIAALSDRGEALDSRTLSGQIGAQVLMEAARARSRRLLADQWIARLESVFHPGLTAVLWIQAEKPKLASISGGGAIERPSDARSALEALAALAIRHRTPMLIGQDQSGPVDALADTSAQNPDPAAARLLDEAEILVERLGGKRGIILPVYDGDDAGSVVVLLFENDHGPALRVEGAEALATLLGEALAIQSHAHPSLFLRLGNWVAGRVGAIFGKTAWKLKLAILIMAAIVVTAAFIPSTVKPGFTARVEARERLVVSAPFDGFLSAAPFQLGDRVAPGDLLVAMEDADLRLRLSQIRAEIAGLDAEIQTARAQRDTAEVRLLDARKQQSIVDLDLVERQLELASFDAGSDALVVGGDAWRRVGDRVRLGEPLMELAMSGAFRVLAFVDEDWISDMPVGAQGELLLTAYPDAPMLVTLTAMGGRPETRDGVNAFPVWLDFDDAPNLQILDGMRGVVRIIVSERSLLEAYSRGAVRWFGRTLWRWS